MLRSSSLEIFPLTHDRPPPARCRACQLQLCKSRLEKPHTALKEVGRDEIKDRVHYACETCQAVLVWSGDKALPGWSHQREST